MNKLLGALISALILCSCSDGSTHVSITNRSSMNLKGVQASGRGFLAYIGELKPGEHKTVKIYPYGEAGLSLGFVVDNRQYKSPASGYFESGYKVTVIVQKDLSVLVDGEL